MTADDEPILLSIGVPVRNGGELLGRALESIAAQTYPHLEVLISDNASSDGTEALCREFAAAHPGVRYVRHEVPLTALENFRYVWSEASGPLFAWVAHDDDRSADFADRLVAALRDDPTAGLAYPTLLVEVPDAEGVATAPFDGSSPGMGFHERARWGWGQSCLPIYGVFRRSLLDAYGWYDANGSADVALLAFVAAYSEIVHVPGPTLTYRLVRKRGDELAGKPSFRAARINIDVARAAVEGDASRTGRRRSVLATFVRLEAGHLLHRIVQVARRGRAWEPLLATDARGDAQRTQRR